MTERDTLAAEYALGLLEGDEAARAHVLSQSDPAFAAEVTRWERHFAPLAGEIADVAPSERVWQRIERALDAENPAPDQTNVVALRRRMRVWQWTAGLAAAAAVVLAVLLVDPAPRPPAAAPVLAGSVPIQDTPLRLAVTYLPDRRALLVSATGIAPDGVHDHELWLVPPEGEALSLGVVEAGADRAHQVDPAVAARIAAGAILALTREPLGGKPEHREAGPVVGQGTLTKI